MGSQGRQQQTHEEDFDATHVIWERKRYYCCLGWQRPLFHSGWKDNLGHTLKDDQHPSTDEYRRAMEGDAQAVHDWEWRILTNEYTDTEGWQYARCFWLGSKWGQPNGRTNERRTDYVRRRQWVHKEYADQVLATAKRGAVRLRDPVQLAAEEREAHQHYKEGVQTVWDLIAQLDNSNNFKSAAMALLDPVALRSVAKRHAKALKGEQAKALKQLLPSPIAPKEVWHEERVKQQVSSALHRQHQAMTPAQLGQAFRTGMGVLFRGVKGTTRAAGSFLQQRPPTTSDSSSQPRSAVALAEPNARMLHASMPLPAARAVSVAPSMGLPLASPSAILLPSVGPTPSAPPLSAASETALAALRSEVEASDRPPSSTTHVSDGELAPAAGSASSELWAAGSSSFSGPVSLRMSSLPDEGSMTVGRSVMRPVRLKMEAVEEEGSDQADNSDAEPDKPQLQEGTDAGSASGSAATSPRLVSPFAASAAPPDGATQQLSAAQFQMSPLGDLSRTAVVGPAASMQPGAAVSGSMASRQTSAALSVGQQARQLSTLAVPDEQQQQQQQRLPTPRPLSALRSRSLALRSGLLRAFSSRADSVAVHDIAPYTEQHQLQHPPPQPQLRREGSIFQRAFHLPIGRHGSAALPKRLSDGGGNHVDTDMLHSPHPGRWKWHRRGRASGKHDRHLEEAAAPRRMVLSVPELECATGHALSIYGDIENYMDSWPMQTYYDAITKFTGVPEADVLLAVWKSQPFKPGHYVAIDRQRRKIVISIRGTMDKIDTITDLVSRPVPYDFGGPGLIGLCHSGILKAAQATVESIKDTLLEAVAKEPSFDVFVTGHSLGGGTSALVALLLRHESSSWLPEQQRKHLRAFCLAPAAVLSKNLAWACQHFICSIIYNWDLVPRVDVCSVAKFVAQVAHASPLKRAILSLYEAWSYVRGGSSSSEGGRSKTPSAVSAAPAAAATAAAAAAQGANPVAAAAEAAQAVLEAGSQGWTSSSEGPKEEPLPDDDELVDNAGNTEAKTDADDALADAAMAAADGTAPNGAPIDDTGKATAVIAAEAAANGSASSVAPNSSNTQGGAGGADVATISTGSAAASDAASSTGGTRIPAAGMRITKPSTISISSMADGSSSVGSTPKLSDAASTSNAVACSSLNGMARAASQRMPPSRLSAESRPASGDSRPVSRGDRPSSADGAARKVQLNVSELWQRQEQALQHAVCALRDLMAPEPAAEPRNRVSTDGAIATPLGIADDEEALPDDRNMGAPARQVAVQATACVYAALDKVHQLQRRLQAACIQGCNVGAVPVERPSMQNPAADPQVQVELVGDASAPVVPGGSVVEQLQEQITLELASALQKLQQVLSMENALAPRRSSESGRPHRLSGAGITTTSRPGQGNITAGYRPITAATATTGAVAAAAAALPLVAQARAQADAALLATSPRRTVAAAAAAPAPEPFSVPTNPAAAAAAAVGPFTAAACSEPAPDASMNGLQGHVHAQIPGATPRPALITRALAGGAPPPPPPHRTKITLIPTSPSPPPGSIPSAPVAGAVKPVAPSSGKPASTAGSLAADDKQSDTGSPATASPELGPDFTPSPSVSTKLLLQPLVPPGAVFWLVPDTRPKPLGNFFAAGNRQQGPRSQGSSRSPPSSPGRPSVAGASNADSVAPSLGSFLGDLTPALDGPEGDTDTEDKPMRMVAGKKALEKQPMVLLNADPTWFADVLFCWKAIQDHVPISYHKALSKLMAQQKQRGWNPLRRQ